MTRNELLRAKNSDTFQKLDSMCNDGCVISLTLCVIMGV